MNSLLINENPLIVLPSLVVEMKGNVIKAMLIQQIYFLCQQPRSGIDHEGHHWIWKSADEWVEDFFIWLTPQTIRKYLVALEESEHIRSTTRIRDQWDNTNIIGYHRSDTFLPVRAGTLIPSRTRAILPVLIQRLHQRLRQRLHQKQRTCQLPLTTPVLTLNQMM